MSWAALLASNKDKTEVTDENKKVSVYVEEDSHLSEAQRALANVQHQLTVELPAYTKGCLVLDANAIIKGMDNFNQIADVFITTTQVIHEIRDRASRELMERLPHTMVVRDPTPEALAEVVACAEKTGDLGVLSRTDIRLCAVALDCCRTSNSLNPPIDPAAAHVNPHIDIISEEVSEEDEEVDEEEEVAHASPEVSPTSEPVPPTGEEEGQQGVTEVAGDAEDDNDEDEWITPENIHLVDAAKQGSSKAFDGGVACVTSDYAMQNTLLHLGVPIVGTNGMRIQELRLWLMRCTGCFTLVMDTTRQFCPGCGSGDTLRRVNYVVNSAGEKQLFINFKKHISTRGTIYNLPRPRGGKHGTNRNLVLREDQLAHIIRGTSTSKLKAQQAVRETDDDELAAFGEPVKHKKRDLGNPRMFSSYHKYNVNEKKKARAAHRK